MITRLFVVLPVVTLISLIIAYCSYQDKRSAYSEIKQLDKIIRLKDKELDFYQKINEKAIQQKIILQNKSLRLTEKLNYALKNQTCADEPVPADVVSKLRRHAIKIRQAAKNSTKFIN